MPRGGGASSARAWVTLVTNADYAVGARALLRSIALTGSSADRVVLHTGGVPEESLRSLEGPGVRLIPIDLLPTSPEFDEAHTRSRIHGAAPFTKGGKPGFHTPLDNFAKLRLWELEEYTRLLFVDADAIVLRPCERLFDYPEFSAAPNVYESLRDFHRLNSGVFVARPSRATFERMLVALDRPGAFWPRTDQTFLQHFFPDWHGLPVIYNTLQYVWLNLPELWDWRSIGILHFQYEKPWDPDNPKAARLAPLIALWRTIADGGPLPDLDTLPLPEGR